jgi:hypothetical protein
MRPLYWGRHQVEPVEVMVLALIAKVRSGPEPLDDFDGVLEPLLAFLRSYIVATILIARGAPPESYIQSAPTEQVQHGRILSDPYGIM